MGAETKKLATISFVTDTDVPYYQIGEPQGSFQQHQLEKYIESHGHEKLCAQLAFMQFQIWETVRKINSKGNDENSSKALNKDIV